MYTNIDIYNGRNRLAVNKTNYTLEEKNVMTDKSKVKTRISVKKMSK